MRTKDCVYAFETDYGTYVIKSSLPHSLKRDRRTKEGKMLAKYEECIFILAEIAFELGEELPDILPQSR